MLDDDPGERVWAGLESASGERPPGCPWRQLRDPFVAAVMRASNRAAKGELEGRFGGHVPEALWRGVEVYESALRSIENYDAKKRVERSERERKQREAERANAPGGGRRRR